jgi:hypothetical protein
MSVILALAVYSSAAMGQTSDQSIVIGIIDFYGLKHLSAEVLRNCLTVSEGDTISFSGDARPAFMAASEARLAALPGVSGARLNLVCCDQGRAIVYVGIQEEGAKAMSFRPAPEGQARLAADIVEAGAELSKAWTLAVERGDAGEDRSQGHSLAHDPATRAIQERFLAYAKRDLPELRRVLRTSSNAAERGLAADVLGYAPDKRAVVSDLVYGLTDPSEEVRNNALRALLVIAEMTVSPEGAVPDISPDPIIVLLYSPVWSDRNKAAGALDALTRNRNPELLSVIRRQAISPLVEMARWKSGGHAQAAFLVLGRVAGYSDEAALDLWQHGHREVVINAAMSQAR